MNRTHALIMGLLLVATTGAADIRTWNAVIDGRASVATNWKEGIVPVSGDTILFDGSSQRAITWDLTNAPSPVVPGAWIQTAAYTGTSTIPCRFPGQGSFTNFTIAGDLILSNGVMTHPPNAGVSNATDRLSISVDGNFTLAAAAKIDVTGRGFAAARGPGAGISANRSGKAASHGGIGACSSIVAPSPCYGSLAAPETLGSGGAYPGGGSIRLMVAGTAVIDGALLAQSTAPDAALTSGGAGGSIYVMAGSLSGSGTVNASGAGGYYTGGGGRIALIATNSAAPWAIKTSATGGTNGYQVGRGAPGTIYCETSADGPGGGTLTIDNGGYAVQPGRRTELPALLETFALDPAVSGEVYSATLVITNASPVALTRSLRIGNFAWLGSNTTIALDGRTLFVRADEPPLPFPADYGNGQIVTNGGRLLWGNPATTLRLVVTNGPHGSVTVDPDEATDYYAFGTNVTLTAAPDTGYTFAFWTGDVPAGSDRTNNPLIVTMDQERSLRALFASAAGSTKTWTGAGADERASTAENWYPASAPVDGDHVVFDATSIKACAWDLNVPLGSWTQDAGYEDSYSPIDGYKGWVNIRTVPPETGAFSNLVINGDVTLQDGAWSHPTNAGGNVQSDWLAVRVGGDFVLGTNARIDVISRGFAAASGPGAGNATQRADGGDVAKGASHGGQGAFGSGATASPCYGSTLCPTNLGSGSNVRGGGAVWLDVAGHATVDGTIIADSTNVATQVSGGAGGSVYLRAASIDGSGSVSANGSQGYYSGGGGRVAFIATNAETIQIGSCQAVSGFGAAGRGCPGTVYLETAAEQGGHGRLIIDAADLAPQTIRLPCTELPPSLTYSNLPALGGELENASLIITNGGRTRLTDSLLMGNFLWLEGNQTLNLNSYTLYLKASEPPLPFPENYGNGTILSNGGSIVWGGGTVRHRLTVTNGPHGTWTRNPDSPDDMYDFGTVVELTAAADGGYTFIWWEGDVPAGSNRTSNPLSVPMDQARSLRALFASAAPNTATWTGDGTNSQASNAGNWYPATAPVSGDHIVFDGTCTKPCTWDLDIVPSSWVQDEGYADSWDPVTGYKGWVWIRTRFPGQGSFTNLTVSGDVSLRDGVWSHTNNSGGDAQADRLSVSIGGALTVGPMASVDVSARGFTAAKGPGAGNNVQRGTAGVGASYGGRGAFGTSAVPAACYGSIVSPTNLGSSATGRGGGAVRLDVAGHSRIDGIISAAAGAAMPEQPGGSGGSIWLTTASLAGTGVLNAAGCSGYASGGGGRIAVWLTVSNSFGDVTMSAPGGPGTDLPYARGAAGTIYRQSPAGKLLVIDNNNYTNSGSFATNWFTELPASNAASESLAGVSMVVTGKASVGLMQDLRMADLQWLEPGSTLYLKGKLLTLRSVRHDFGTGSVVTEDGRLIWNQGTLYLLK